MVQAQEKNCLPRAAAADFSGRDMIGGNKCIVV